MTVFPQMSHRHKLEPKKVMDSSAEKGSGALSSHFNPKRQPAREQTNSPLNIVAYTLPLEHKKFIVNSKLPRSISYSHLSASITSSENQSRVSPAADGLKEKLPHVIVSRFEEKSEVYGRENGEHFHQVYPSAPGE